MRLLYGFIPRLYAPLRSLTRQSFGPPPVLAAANAATGTFGLSNRMSTSSALQSSASSSVSSTQANGAAEARKANDGQQEQALPDEGHRQHHPTKSTSPAPENATSSAPAADSASTDSSQPRPQQQSGQPLALPPLPELPTSGNSAGAAPPTTVLDLGGQQGGGASTKLDHLGPLVVHQDGTMSRINNWGEMTEIERQNTLRILGKRNQIRLATLRDGAGGEGQRG